MIVSYLIGFGVEGLSGELVIGLKLVFDTFINPGIPCTIFWCFNSF
jgi:hypothetical protein